MSLGLFAGWSASEPRDAAPAAAKIISVFTGEATNTHISFHFDCDNHYFAVYCSINRQTSNEHTKVRCCLLQSDEPLLLLRPSETRGFILTQLNMPFVASKTDFYMFIVSLFKI